MIRVWAVKISVMDWVQLATVLQHLNLREHLDQHAEHYLIYANIAVSPTLRNLISIVSVACLFLWLPFSRSLPLLDHARVIRC